MVDTSRNLWADAIYAFRRLTQAKIVAAGSLAGAWRRSLSHRFPSDRRLASSAVNGSEPERLFAVAFRSSNVLDGRLLTYLNAEIAVRNCNHDRGPLDVPDDDNGGHFQFWTRIFPATPVRS